MANFYRRHAAEADLSASNPIPRLGEVVLALDKGYTKIGDGATAFNALPIQNTSGGATINDSATATGTTWSSSEIEKRARRAALVYST
jgi:hypothetical protein